MNSSKICTQRMFTKIAVLLVLSLGITFKSSATTIIAFAKVELGVNAVVGDCVVSVINPPNPITYFHNCQMTVKLPGQNEMIKKAEVTNVNGVPIPNGQNTVTFPDGFVLQETPTVNCTYCTKVRDIRVRNSAGNIVEQNIPGVSDCEKKRGIGI